MTMAALIETTPFGRLYRGAWVNQSDQGNVITSLEFGARTAAESLRESLEPIRKSLLAEYPDCAALLDAETWPNRRVH